MDDLNVPAERGAMLLAMGNEAQHFQHSELELMLVGWIAARAQVDDAPVQPVPLPEPYMRSRYRSIGPAKFLDLFTAVQMREYGKACALASLPGAVPQGADVGGLTALDYRAQGREEALAIILAEDPENPFEECTHTSANGDAGDYSTHWNDDKLRELLHIGDRKHDAYDRAEAAYWEAMGRTDAARCEKNMVERAPFYKPLHDFLAMHKAYDLMASLKRAADEVPDPVPQAASQIDRIDLIDGSGWLRREAKTTGENGWLMYGNDDKLIRALAYSEIRLVDSALAAPVPQAVAAPDDVAQKAARYDWLRGRMQFSTSKGETPEMGLSSWIPAPEHDPHKDWIGERFEASVDRTIDAAMCATKGENNETH